MVSNSNQVSTRDTNIYVASPTYTGSLGITGSYVGVETADPGSTGSIQLRTTTVGCVYPAAGQSYTASDILQTFPDTILSPSYLATSGIQIGPGVDLVTKSAGGKGFSTYTYPTTLYYGLKGFINVWNGGAELGQTGFCWPGTQAVTNGSFPDITIPRAFYRIQQPTLISGLSASLGSGPSLTGGTPGVFLTVGYTPISTGTYTTTPFQIGLTGPSNLPSSGSYYNASTRLNAGDLLHLQIQYSGAGNDNEAADLSCQIDLY